jgi:methyl-accepting chemotaxis protein
MDRVSRGERELRSNVNSDDEIGQLSTIFNDMIDNLNRYMERQIEYEATQERMKY